MKRFFHSNILGLELFFSIEARRECPSVMSWQTLNPGLCESRWKKNTPFRGAAVFQTTHNDSPQPCGFNQEQTAFSFFFFLFFQGHFSTDVWPWAALCYLLLHLLPSTGSHLETRATSYSSFTLLTSFPFIRLPEWPLSSQYETAASRSVIIWLSLLLIKNG